MQEAISTKEKAKERIRKGRKEALVSGAVSNNSNRSILSAHTAIARTICLRTATSDHGTEVDNSSSLLCLRQGELGLQRSIVDRPVLLLLPLLGLQHLKFPLKMIKQHTLHFDSSERHLAPVWFESTGRHNGSHFLPRAWSWAAHRH